MMKELKNLQDSVEQIEKLYSDYDDMMLLIEMSQEDADEETVQGIEEELEQFEKTFEELRISTLLTGPYDKDNAIVTLHAGAGGTESCDWAGMLYRMYTRWAEKKGYAVEVLDYLEGDVAGIKGVTFEVKGENAYGYLRSEKGVHRLVRISPFNAAGKRQTSFASCDVIPDIEEDIDIEINEDDLKIDTYRSSGAGGQHINKTSSAVRITHIPTGIVISCQDEKSQLKNKDKGLKVLRSRLYDLELEKKKKEEAANRKNQVGTGDRSEKIRTYNFPQGRCTDHRIKLTLHRLDDILNGDLDEIIDSLTAADQAAKLSNMEEEG